MSFRRRTATTVGWRPAAERGVGPWAREVLGAAAVGWLQARGTHGDLLHRVVRQGMAELRVELEEADRSLPAFVWQELERYVGCGDPERGFAWLECEDCDGHRLVPFTCKGRSFCPCCCGRRMADRAARWCDTLLAAVPHRQWVLTVPWDRRKVLAYRPELARGVLDLALREVFGWLEGRAREEHGVTGGRTAAVTVEQRFGSSLALNLHFHSLLPDGVWVREPEGGLRFCRVTPTRADVQALVERIAERAEAFLRARLDDEEPDPDDAQAVLVAASAAGRVAAGTRAGRPVRRLGHPPSPDPDDPDDHRGISSGGYGLHAGTWVPASDRHGLERLARYLLRPPLAKARLEERPDGQVVLHLRRPWRDGTTAFVFSPLELTEKLAALVMRPRVHHVHFHGVYAPHAAWRPDVVRTAALARADHHAELARRQERRLLRRRARRRLPPRSSWCPWADLLERVFGAHGFTCPRCGGQMRLRAVVVGPPATRRILAGLGRSSRGPP